MVIYIHGFSGSGEGVKAKLFREYYKNSEFLAPSLSYIPALAISTLSEIIETFKESREIKLIGSSLGGYYAIYLANKYSLKAVLLNPSIHPDVTLKPFVGNAASFYDNSYFSWCNEHIDYLQSIKTESVDESRFFLLVQKGDEVLDYKEALNKFINSKKIVEEDGNHSFIGIQSHFIEIENF